MFDMKFTILYILSSQITGIKYTKAAHLPPNSSSSLFLLISLPPNSSCFQVLPLPSPFPTYLRLLDSSLLTEYIWSHVAFT